MTHDKPAPITLDDPDRPIDPAILDAPGGFVWWYCDAVDANGNGVVLIWSFGLPFLPGVLSAARRGTPLPPRARPCLNVVWYQNGREALYVLQTYDEKDASWKGGRFRFGRSRITVSRSAGRHSVRARLDCDVPRSKHPLKGTIELSGAPASRGEGMEFQAKPLHAWTPLTGPARLRAHVTHGALQFRHVGLAYHDRNFGFVPLDQLGIGRWSWGRVVGRNRTSVHYLVWDEQGELQVGWLGRIERSGRFWLEEVKKVELTGERNLTYGMPHAAHTRVTLMSGDEATWEEPAIVDEGPFYVRTLQDGDAGLGVAEHVVPSRIDRPLARPLVRMRVHATHEKSSWWLPLFSGPQRGRWSRLFGLEPRRTP